MPSETAVFTIFPALAPFPKPLTAATVVEPPVNCPLRTPAEPLSPTAEAATVKVPLPIFSQAALASASVPPFFSILCA